MNLRNRILLFLSSVLLFIGCSDDKDKSSVKNITQFSLNSLNANIDEENHTITLKVPFDTDLSALSPSLVFQGERIIPSLGEIVDFRSPVIYKVFAEDGTVQEYTVVVTEEKSSEAELIQFSFGGLNPPVTGILNANTKIVSVDVPFGTNLSNMSPSISFKGNTIQPASGIAQDFSKQVFYTITAQDGTEYEFSVMVSTNPFQPQITKVNRTQFAVNDEIIIQGSFSKTGNEIVLRNSTNPPIYPKIIRESQTSITAIIPSLASPGDYDMTVASYIDSPAKGSTVYSDSKITIVTPEFLRPKILSVTPTSIISGTTSIVNLKTEKMADFENRHAQIYIVYNSSQPYIEKNYSVDGNNADNISLNLGYATPAGIYKIYLDRNGYKSNEITVEVKENTYVRPIVQSVSNLNPIEGDIITVKGSHFTSVSGFDTYVQVHKVYGSHGFPKDPIKATVVDDNTLTFRVPYIESATLNSDEIKGLIRITIVANGQQDSYLEPILVKKR